MVGQKYDVASIAYKGPKRAVTNFLRASYTSEQILEFVAEMTRSNEEEKFFPIHHYWMGTNQVY